MRSAEHIWPTSWVAPGASPASLIVTSNRPFSAWGEVFGDEIAAAAMIDRLVHHAEMVSLEGNTYRMKGQGPQRGPKPLSGQ